MSSDDTAPSKEQAPEPACLPPDPTELLDCEACTVKLSTDHLLRLECADHYCLECLASLFENAIKDETMFPPRCCGINITTKTAGKYLPKSVVKQFKRKQLELRTKNRTYCWRPRCSTFIAPHSTHNGQAICQKCRAVTCCKCKNAWHFGPCVEGDDAAFFDFVRANKLKKCPTCKRFVEKNGGCEHVVCRCGCEMCYDCGDEIDECACSSDVDEDENDLADGQTGYMLYD